MCRGGRETGKRKSRRRSWPGYHIICGYGGLGGKQVRAIARATYWTRLCGFEFGFEWTLLFCLEDWTGRSV